MRAHPYRLPVRLLRLYAKSRRTTASLAAIVGITAVTLTIVWTWTKTNDDPVIPVLAPLAMAAVLGASTATSMPELEGTAVQRLWIIRAIHVGGLLLCALGGTWLYASRLTVEIATSGAFRNLLGGMGLALLTAHLIGPGLSWVPPTTWSFAALMPDVHDGHARLWAWPALPDGDKVAAAWALALFTAGTAANLLKSPDVRRNTG